MGLLSDTYNCGLCMPRCRERFPRKRIQRKPPVSDPGIHHGTCVTHVPWCMSGSLTSCGRKTFPAFMAHAQPSILHIWQEAHGLQAPLRLRVLPLALPTKWLTRTSLGWLTVRSWSQFASRADLPLPAVPVTNNTPGVASIGRQKLDITLRHGQNGQQVADSILKDIFVNEIFCILIQISLFVPNFQFVPNAHQLVSNLWHQNVWYIHFLALVVPKAIATSLF